VQLAADLAYLLALTGADVIRPLLALITLLTAILALRDVLGGRRI
jgi:hypothetical protein